MTVGVVQARLGSSRLPGKALAPLGGIPALSRVVRRLGRATRLDGIMVATTSDPDDDPVEELARSEGCDVYRGHPTDVLDRYLRASESARAGLIVRITADCPLVMPEIVDRVVAEAVKGGFDYTSNTLQRTFPKGLDVECFTFDALRRSASKATVAGDREHVTPFMKRNALAFSHGEVRAAPDRSDLRWTLDYPEDLVFLDRVFRDLGDPLGPEDVAGLMERDEEVAAMHRAAVARADG